MNLRRNKKSKKIVLESRSLLTPLTLTSGDDDVDEVAPTAMPTLDPPPLDPLSAADPMLSNGNPGWLTMAAGIDE